MDKYNVTGMSCAACSARVEKAVNAVEGVESCAVNLLTNSMVVTGSASPSSIINAVVAAGYGASIQGAKNENENESKVEDKETKTTLYRLIASIILIIPLMYVSMGHTMWGWYVPSFLNNNYIALALIQMVLSAIVMVINQKFFINGFKGVLHLAPNMDTLVAMGSSASFLYSLYVVFSMTGNMAEAHSYIHDLYFESAAMILTLITVGKMLEARSKGKTTNALKALMDLAPKTAVIIKDGKEVKVNISQVKRGDIFILKSGDSIPVDGVVLEGESAVNESSLTGESIPVDKSEGSQVSAGTINLSGYLKCEATNVGEDTTLSQIIKMVSDAAATKAPIAKIADRVSGVFVPVVILIAVVTTLIWLLLGETTAFAIGRGISVLVISCPCALGLATPVAIMVGSGMGAKYGIMFKSAKALEETGRVKVVALDKTGTITKGKASVTDVKSFGIDKREL